jgi:hypothetical protein
MFDYFDIEGFRLDKLLLEWKWLTTSDFDLVAVNLFGDLFLADADGVIHRLDITGGTLRAIAASADEFREAAQDLVRRRDWFLEELSEQAEQKGLSPMKGQCIGCKIPPVFKQSRNAPNNFYVADLYEYVSFMGDLHNQINDVPDGGQVTIKIQPRPMQ